MKKILLIYVICFFPFQISAQVSEPYSPEYIVLESDSIPQGKLDFELYFAEWGVRMANAPCEVIIEGQKITVQQTSGTNLSGEKIMVKGVLMKHTSGTWIIGEDRTEVEAEEIGGCSGGPIPIDFKEKVIEWC